MEERSMKENRKMKKNQNYKSSGQENRWIGEMEVEEQKITKLGWNVERLPKVFVPISSLPVSTRNDLKSRMKNLKHDTRVNMKK